MILKSIKLVGFKSFVDPTTIPFKGSLTAVVGPNGCGKSNVVDAIRWVVGESSAKQLRGQSMSDVIFNGTTKRQAVGRVAVELSFDNQLGRLTGEFAGYKELCVKREMSRDGQSSYFINNTPCRRRDILDIFLGTGLGPRSYAIIEQGMVSRIIEAKPEDFRIYIEEAAGISKYKERRKETESRMKRTRENLDRIMDLHEEISKQLKHLRRQANAAERYQVFKEEEKVLSAQLKAIQWKELQEKLNKKDEKIGDHGAKRAAMLQEQEQLEESLRDQKQAYANANTKHGEVQKQFYEFDTSIARLEENIDHRQHQLAGWRKELDNGQVLWQELTEVSEENDIRINEIENELSELAPNRENLSDAAERAQQDLIESKQAMTSCQSRWEILLADLAQIKQQIEVNSTNQHHYDAQINQLTVRVEELKEISNSQSDREFEVILNPLHENKAQAEKGIEKSKECLAELSQAIKSMREHNNRLQSDLQALRLEQQQQAGKLTSLQTLQQGALGKDKQQSQAWLSEQGIAEQPRLAELIKVEQGWEQAVEVVLEQWMESVCIDDLSAISNESHAGTLSLLSPGQAIHSQAKGLLQPLLSKINSEWSLPAWLRDVYVAHDVQEAKNEQANLAEHESIVTPEGFWVGPNWSRMVDQQEQESSVLARQQILEQLKITVADLEHKAAQQAEQLEQDQQAFLKLETARDNEQIAHQQATTVLNDVKAKLSAELSRQSAWRERQESVMSELGVAQDKLTRLQSNLSSAESQHEEFSKQRVEIEKLRETLSQERAQAQAKLEQIREEAQEAKQTFDELDVRIASNESQRAVLQSTLSRDKKQLEQISARREVLESELSEGNSPLQNLKEELSVKFQERSKIKEYLREAKSSCDTIGQQIVVQENAIKSQINHIEQWQQKVQAYQVERQTLVVRQTTLEEQLVEEGSELEVVVAELPEEANAADWQKALDSKTQRIQRLGAINLAAVDECQELETRKTYIDEQRQDLEEGLAMLENAIRKIDKETKTKFQETFDVLNSNFQTLFPQVFGGGRACLELTDNEILTAGILIKAQPPGKRNVNLHMLSGGEKAMTAVALIFSLFQLNPAPFCVLDEVDAPLDDANVGRFCELIKQMADKTQFIIISHNKLTMSIAKHLMGVTMQEPGVSRIVSVDMNEAVSMVDE